MFPSRQLSETNKIVEAVILLWEFPTFLLEKIIESHSR